MVRISSVSISFPNTHSTPLLPERGTETEQLPVVPPQHRRQTDKRLTSGFTQQGLVLQLPCARGGGEHLESEVPRDESVRRGHSGGGAALVRHSPVARRVRHLTLAGRARITQTTGLRGWGWNGVE